MNTYIRHSDILQPYSSNKFGSIVVEDWTEAKKIRLDIARQAIEKVGGKVHLRIFPRRMVRTVWEYEKPGVPFPQKEYAFRAFARGSQITIFDDETESEKSILWLLLHELGHVWVSRNDKLRSHFRTMKKPKGYLTSDSAHEAAPEEQFANMMADNWFKQLMDEPGSYHRIWWRKQVIGI
jgi:hypothetical protein